MKTYIYYILHKAYFKEVITSWWFIDKNILKTKSERSVVE